MTHTTKRRDWGEAASFAYLECSMHYSCCPDEGIHIGDWCLNCLAREMVRRLIEIDGEEKPDE